MKLPSLLRRQLLGPFLVALLAAGVAEGQDGAPAKGRGGERGDHERSQVWESLKPEQREKLREAMREAWTDPAVINAREEVKHATEAYQAAVKSVVERVDPSVAELLAKVQTAKGGKPVHGVGGGNAPRGFDEQINPPGFLERLDPEVREKFQRAEVAAMESEVVKTARSELGRIRDEDQALRRRRLEAHRQLRRVTLEEMVRIDPSLAEVQKRLGGVGRGGASRKGGEGTDRKGEGKRGKPVKSEGEKDGKDRKDDAQADRKDP